MEDTAFTGRACFRSSPRTEGGWKTGRTDIRGTGTVTPPREHRLKTIPLEKFWPTLPADALAFTELEQDEMYPFLPTRLIPRYLEEAMAFGREAAKGESCGGDLTRLINRILRSGVRVDFVRRKVTDPGGWVRAQYRPKPPTIEIYRSSMDQLRTFFEQSVHRVAEDDLIALHLYHEWFHHLESTRFGRADHRLPKVRKKRWGPFVFRQRVYRLREIAAHSFTQETMELSWSPLWLDHLLLLTEKGWSKSRIREHFRQLNDRFEALIAPPPEEEEKE
ncbi:hypothetical protein C8P63_11236 [Melghirimyces profundicolus]|uniref:Uncharacterized protein n=1 Tax=Melghirimyces profundicolus TaxID=1242148 RepID=A0A2T6BTE1_9BACL|nr:hypothetical protein C8P63_11236 [Melghirimyces profundicolus]